MSLPRSHAPSSLSTTCGLSEPSTAHPHPPALTPTRVGNQVLQTLLALAEFMEHDEKPLPIDIRKLGSVAENCQVSPPLPDNSQLSEKTPSHSDHLAATAALLARISGEIC